MKKGLLVLFLCLTANVTALLAQQPIVRFKTVKGNIDVQLFPDVAPATVANFLGYVDRGDYNTSFIHRSVPGFVIQGGGYTFLNGTVQTIPAQPAVVNEYHLSNTRGTIAMAKLGTDPNSATDEWFFNLADNGTTGAMLDTQNGGFTVFGKIIDDASLAVMDAIAALPTSNQGSPFDALPVIDYTSGTITASNLVIVNAINHLPSHPAFFNGEALLGNDFYYLAFPNGNIFGYYSYQFFPYLFHQELGFEYFIDANDGQGGAYLYDFASNTFFYTSPTFSFPYLYDFSLDAVLYYFPDTNNPGHYTTNPRYFANLKTGQIITK